MTEEPTMGRVVDYRSRTGNYSLPAIVTATEDTLWPEGVALGHVPALSSEMHVHLRVFTPGEQGDYTEHDVPFDAQAPIAGRVLTEASAVREPGTWAWPERRR